MSDTYSTLQSEMRSGKTYSSRHGLVTVVPPPVREVAQTVVAQTAVAPSPVVPADPGTSLRFSLASHGLPMVAQVGPDASGSVTAHYATGDAWTVTAGLQGIKPLGDPALAPVLWLVHDLRVPADLDPADLAALPRGSGGMGNQPGAIFTVDGNVPDLSPEGNTLAIAISPGPFTAQADGTWQLTATVHPKLNAAFHPLVLLGPTVLADMNAALPSGTVAEVLTDLFMRPVTVEPGLKVRDQLPYRLASIMARRLTEPTAQFLSPERFTRAAVTLEGPVRSTPTLMPSRETCFLAAYAPDQNG